jgi:hypothetical protein
MWGGPISSGSPLQEKTQDKIEKAKIYQENYPLISDSDHYCSLYAVEKPESDLRIVAGMRGDEHLLLTDGDKFYLNKGTNGGLEPGQVFLIVEIGDKLISPVSEENFGFLAFKRGRARIVAVEGERSLALAEKSCGQVTVGNYLIPFEEKEDILGKDEGFEVPLEEGIGLNGHVIYLDREYQIIGSGYWAIIDLGIEDGLKAGQQLSVFRKLRADLPRQAIGNAIVIDVRQRTSTIKVLSAKETIEIGNQVQSKD